MILPTVQLDLISFSILEVNNIKWTMTGFLKITLLLQIGLLLLPFQFIKAHSRYRRSVIFEMSNDKILDSVHLRERQLTTHSKTGFFDLE